MWLLNRLNLFHGDLGIMGWKNRNNLSICRRIKIHTSYPFQTLQCTISLYVVAGVSCMDLSIFYFLPLCVCVCVGDLQLA